MTKTPAGAAATVGSVSTYLINDTLFNNSSDDLGGGLFLKATNSGTGTNQTQLVSLTVTQNEAATDGGGIFLDAASPAKATTVWLNNNIIDGNTVTAAGFAGPVNVAETPATMAAMNVSESYNLVGTSDALLFTDPSDKKNNTTGLAMSLAPNGALPGYPETLALTNTSPAYLQGDPSVAAFGGTDERGFARQYDPPIGLFVSMGAYDPDAGS